MRSPAMIAALLVALGLAGLAWSLPQLEHGLIEVPQHWWSGLAAAPLALGLLLDLGAWLRGRGRRT